MSRPRLTIRLRLTLLYTGLSAVCGATVIAITYGLVASLPDFANTGPGRQQYPAAFVSQCQQALTTPDADPGLLQKCNQAYQEGLAAGALGQRQATLQHILQYSLIALVVVTALAAVIGWLIAGRVLRPVHRITAAARTASEHNLAARVGLTGPRDELRELADTFDSMLARLESSFAGQQRFIANASHELRTPLAVMGATVDVVLAKPEPTAAELRRMGVDIRTAVDRSEALIDALLTLARNAHARPGTEALDLTTLTEDVLDAADPGDRRIDATLGPAAVTGDPVLLTRLVANLVDNAIRHNTPRGSVHVATSTVDGEARLVVTNTGPTIPAGAVAGLFEPFRRLHERHGEGFGLGLAIVASVASLHDGSVVAAPGPGGGLTITVRLPGLAAESWT